MEIWNILHKWNTIYTSSQVFTYLPVKIGWNHPYSRKRRGTKYPPDEGERGEWQSWIKTRYSKNEDHGIWSHHFMTNRWGKSENSDWFSFWGPQITVDSDCSHDIKRCLLLRRKAMTNLESILKSKGITLLTKVHLVKITVFPVVMHGCESWTTKKAEHWRIVPFDPFKVLEKTWESLELQGDQTSQS